MKKWIIWISAYIIGMIILLSLNSIADIYAKPNTAYTHLHFIWYVVYFSYGCFIGEYLPIKGGTMKRTVIVKKETEVEVELTQDQMAEALKSYRDSIAPEADEDDIFRQIAFTVSQYSEFVEGIGDAGTDFKYEIQEEDTDTEIVDDYEEE